ncbi:MAG: double-strand break repair protein AddB [Pseudomonadota bacterium]
MGPALTLFKPAEGPRVFALPPGVDYAAGFAAGLRARLGALAPEAPLGIEVLVNTRRAARTLEEALAADGLGFLPRLSLLEALPSRAGALGAAPLGPATDPLRRHLTLIELTEAWIARRDSGLPAAAAPDLAASLAELVDTLDEAGIGTGSLEGALAAATAAEAGGGAPTETLAAHWQAALGFLDIVRAHWPALREAMMPGALDPAARQRAAIDRLLAAWQETPPQRPLIVAGSTGSRPGTAALMAAVARLGQGALVLPGFEPSVSASVWEASGADHPFGPFQPLFARLGIGPADVEPWCPEPEGDVGGGGAARRRLMGEALRPAPVTDAWAGARGEIAALAPRATAGMKLLEAPHPRAEAAAIALAVREALAEPGRRIAIVTRDAALARRVTAELDRFGVLPDDSLGRPLALTPPALFFSLVLEAARQPDDAVTLAALIGHPFCRLGLTRVMHRRLAAAYERRVLRERGAKAPEGALLPLWPADDRGSQAEAGTAQVDAPIPADEEGADPVAWLARLEAALLPLAHALQASSPLATTLAAHRRAAEALARGPVENAVAEEAEGDEPVEAADPMAAGADAGALRRVLDGLEAAAEDGGAAMGANTYAALLDGLLRAETIRPDAGRPHPRVAIWGTMEARTAAADLTILAGLNEGAWPALPDPGPWLTRQMRVALGLALPERAVGLSAHDFLQAACRPEVILSRASRSGGEPTVPSRWLLRLETLLGGTDAEALEEMRERGRQILERLPLLDRPADPADPQLAPAWRPSPTPAVEARPRHLSASDIERLIRDPYAVYARRVLGLRPLEPLGAVPDARDRGTVLHLVMERFMAGAAPGPVDAAAEAARLVAIGEAVIDASLAEPAEARFWRARVATLAEKIAADEVVRREGVAGWALEAAGALSFPVEGRQITLTARADRIDRRADGTGSVYDYKSTPPSQSQIGIFQHQLHLQALMLAEGAFEGLPPLPPAPGAYIGLANGRSTAPREPLDAAALETYRERLCTLLAHYMAPERGYLSRRATEREATVGDYDHLARRGEWEGRDG